MQLHLALPRAAVSEDATYFWSGSNHAGEIDGLARNGRHVGVTITRVRGESAAMEAILALVETPKIRIIADVARNGSGKPMVFVPKGRQLLPEGDAEVQIGGERVTMGFRKVAINTARRGVQAAKNVLGDLLGKLYGERAGERGQKHKLALELTRVGWRARRVEIDEIKSSGARVFVDSGAFSEVAFNKPAADGSLPYPSEKPYTWVAAQPITDADWQERLANMTRIVEGLGERCYPVAPDRVGDQDETLRRLERYAPTVRRWRKLGAHVIVPIQKGRLSQADFDRECSRVLGFTDYVRGIPSNKAAATPAEIGELVRSLPAGTEIHLLGIGPRSRNWADVMAAVPAGYPLTCDSAGIPSMVGRKNGAGKGPRALTRIRDALCRELGIAPQAGERDVPRTTMIKALMLDRLFGEQPALA